MNISQQALGACASMCRGDVVDFEHGVGTSESSRWSGSRGRWGSTSQTCSRK
jgi:hypothetical protein